MRPRVCLFASAVLILLINGAPLPAATAESVNLASVDACSLLTQTEMSAAVGTPMNPGEHPSPDTGSCTWRSRPASATGAQTPGVLLLLSVARLYAAFGPIFLAEEDRAGIQRFTSVLWLGDDAYYESEDGIETVLSVKKEAIVVQVTWVGGSDQQSVLDAEKTIAAQALSKL